MEAKTEFADARFKAEDNHGSIQFIGTFENGSPANTILHDRANFRLRLKPGHSFKHAEDIADFLNEHIDGISITTY